MNTLNWIVLPAGIDAATGRARMSLVAQPRVDSPTGELNDTPLSEWPVLVGRPSFFVVVSGPDDHLPATITSPAPDPALWRALFKPTTRTGPVFVPEPGQWDSLVPAPPYDGALATANRLYAEALATSPTAPLRADHPVIRAVATLARMSDGGPADGERAAEVAPLADLVRHLREGAADPDFVPPVAKPLDGVTPIEEIDIHHVLGLLGNHPVLARRLGLIFDFTVPVSPALVGSQLIRAVGGTGPLTVSGFTTHSMWSAVTCDPEQGLFTMTTRPGSGTEVAGGQLDLQPHKAVVGDVDVQALARQLALLGTQVNDAAAGRREQSTFALPPRRDIGLTFAQVGSPGTELEFAL